MPPVSASSTTLFFAQPQEVSAAYYQAFRDARAEQMMAVWAEDEEIICTHPGAIPLVGYSAVHSAWKAIFSSSPRLVIELRNEQWHISATMATQNVIEWVRVDADPTPRGGVAVTNVYMRTINGWRMLVHHGSPIAGAQYEQGHNIVLH